MKGICVTGLLYGITWYAFALSRVMCSVVKNADHRARLVAFNTLLWHIAVLGGNRKRPPSTFAMIISYS